MTPSGAAAPLVEIGKSDDVGAWDRGEIEPRIKTILDRTVRQRATGPYRPKSDAEVIAMLGRFFAHKGYREVAVTQVSRMSGGASKEQFAFTFRHAGDTEGERLVLRMDPLEAIAQTCRGREAEVQRLMADHLPIAPVRFHDADGDLLGQPAVILGFVAGVTEPTALRGKGVSGMGGQLGEFAAKLAPQYIHALATTHRFDVANTTFDYFSVPRANSRQAAIWQVNWWSRVWWDSLVEPVPMVTLAERWLRENAPVCDTPVLVHSDLRMGNFMFEEPSGDFTAVLDWELAHIGDLHEDLAWTTQKIFGAWRDDGVFLVSGLLPRDEFFRLYEEASGNRIDPVRLHYYEVLNAYKCAVMDLGQAMRAAKEGNNHQEVVLTWLGSAGAVFLDHIVTLIGDR
ncbi:phosphotransferase family protein [Sphingomonas sp. CGMCC 1.13654]|uniref:Phosphotransferase family protein n=1 Tax=Sphingomonas chungangi TaxID=2683589 RepID=A0A838L9N5_9SPHN|nr:phosphotransferase family protein [Sphingomonas chungangi]MBA2935522.1 phosphotransferase family protein [Sphingomonas chungangi]MVW57029.1 phosphotransferase [Sphingomonas chungangi]